VIFAELPQTSTGKIQKHVLRSEARPHDRNRHHPRPCGGTARGIARPLVRAAAHPLRLGAAQHAADCRAAAQWVCGQLRAIGFTADVRETKGHPVVVGHHPAPPAPAATCCSTAITTCSRPSPGAVDQPPFEPVLKEGRVTARGAVDDKGQTMTWLEALRFWHETAGGPPCRITVW